MGKIIVEMAGGLGNQLSQYAMMKWLEDKYPKADVYANIDYFKKNECHNGYELEKLFQLNLPYVSYTGIRHLKYFFDKRNRIEQVYESGYPEDARLNDLQEDRLYILRGTWHNYNYMHVMDKIFEEIQFPDITDPDNLNDLAAILDSNAVSIHVRGGDYRDLGLNVCSDEYYVKAIDLIKSKVDSPKFFVFTNDEAHLREFSFFAQTDMKIINGNKGNNAWKDMYLMAQCKHNILANSTFSHWGGMLNKNEDKIVIRPRMQTPDKETWPVDGWYII